MVTGSNGSSKDKERDREEFLRALREGFSSAFLQFAPDKDRSLPKKKRALARLLNPKRSDIQARIDLHGLTRERARDALLKFLSMAQQKRMRCVLVIHGKGTGKIKEEVLEILNQYPSVTDFKKASAPLGGEGAMVVILCVKN